MSRKPHEDEEFPAFRREQSAFLDPPHGSNGRGRKKGKDNPLSPDSSSAQRSLGGHKNEWKVQGPQRKHRVAAEASGYFPQGPEGKRELENLVTTVVQQRTGNHDKDVANLEDEIETIQRSIAILRETEQVRAKEAEEDRELANRYGGNFASSNVGSNFVSLGLGTEDPYSEASLYQPELQNKKNEPADRSHQADQNSEKTGDHVPGFAATPLVEVPTSQGRIQPGSAPEADVKALGFHEVEVKNPDQDDDSDEGQRDRRSGTTTVGTLPASVEMIGTKRKNGGSKKSATNNNPSGGATIFNDPSMSEFFLSPSRTANNRAKDEGLRGGATDEDEGTTPSIFDHEAMKATNLPASYYSSPSPAIWTRETQGDKSSRQHNNTTNDSVKKKNKRATIIVPEKDDQGWGYKPLPTAEALQQERIQEWAANPSQLDERIIYEPLYGDEGVSFQHDGIAIVPPTEEDPRNRAERDITENTVPNDNIHVERSVGQKKPIGADDFEVFDGRKDEQTLLRKRNVGGESAPRQVQRQQTLLHNTSTPLPVPFAARFLSKDESVEERTGAQQGALARTSWSDEDASVADTVWTDQQNSAACYVLDHLLPLELKLKGYNTPVHELMREDKRPAVAGVDGNSESVPAGTSSPTNLKLRRIRTEHNPFPQTSTELREASRSDGDLWARVELLRNTMRSPSKKNAVGTTS